MDLISAQLEQLKILKHAYHIDQIIKNDYSVPKLTTILSKLINSKYFNKKTNIITINSRELDEFFLEENIKYHEVLVTLGRNKITYKKRIHRPKINGKTLTLYTTYKIFLVNQVSNNLATT